MVSPQQPGCCANCRMRDFEAATAGGASTAHRARQAAASPGGLLLPALQLFTHPCDPTSLCRSPEPTGATVQARGGPASSAQHHHGALPRQRGAGCSPGACQPPARRLMPCSAPSASARALGSRCAPCHAPSTAQCISGGLWGTHRRRRGPVCRAAAAAGSPPLARSQDDVLATCFLLLSPADLPALELVSRRWRDVGEPPDGAAAVHSRRWQVPLPLPS